MNRDRTIDRPLSIWVTQVLLVIALINGVVLLAFMLSSCSSIESLNCRSPDRIGAFLFYLTTLAAVSLAFWGLQKRKRYGKWLAVGFLTVAIAATLAESRSIQLIYRSITQWQPLPAPPYECWEESPGSSIIFSCGYESYQGLVLRIFLDMLPALIPGLLAVRLVYSRSVKRFFLQ